MQLDFSSTREPTVIAFTFFLAFLSFLASKLADSERLLVPSADTWFVWPKQAVCVSEGSWLGAGKEAVGRGRSDVAVGTAGGGWRRGLAVVSVVSLLKVPHSARCDVAEETGHAF